MPFLNKNLRSNPSLVKPIIIIVSVLLVIGGAYAFLGEKKPNNPTEAAVPPAPEAPKAEINPSGLDKDMRVKNVEDAEKVIEKWIAANPKAIIDSVNNMQKKMMEEQTKNAQKTIGTKLDELFADKNAPEYAPAGYDVSIVEFFDYSCGYCKKAQATVEELLQSDKKVRVVYKEFPILGQPSHEITEVALAIQLVEPASYKKFHDAMMKSNERGKDAAIKVAKSVGISGAKVEASLKNNKDKITGMIQANLVLGNSIGINGTPGFVIGEELIPGALELDALKAKIAEVRAKK
jgi:protein-disulfide isomerase